MSPLRYLLSLLLLQAAFGAETVVLFDPADRTVGPFPANSFTVPDAQQKTGLRVNLPLPDCGAEPSSCEETAWVNVLDGFSLFPRGTVRFSSAPDLDSMQFGTFIVWLDDGFEPAGTMTQIDQLSYDAASNTVFFKPNGALDQSRRYLLIVTDSVVDKAGDPVLRSNAFEACVAAPADDYCADLSAALSALDAPEAVMGAALFTTLSATDWLEAVRDGLDSRGANPRPSGEVSSVQFPSVLSLELNNEIAPGQFATQTFPFPSFLLPNVGTMYFAQFDAPSFLEADKTIAPWSTAGPAPEPTGRETIQFHVLTPRTAPGPSGYPVVLFAHAIGDFRFGGSTIAANGFAAEGFATVAFNAVGHGGGAAGTVRLETTSGPVVQSIGGRSVDLDGDGAIGVSEGCALPFPAAGLRDCLRQTAVEWMYLRRALEELRIDGLDLDLNRVYLAGQSLGAVQAALVHAVDPTIEVAALSVGGGTLVELARLSPTFRNILGAYFTQLRQPPIGDVMTPFDDEYPLRLRGASPVRSGNALSMQDVLEIAEWAQMPGDPIAFAPRFKRSPLDGVPAKRTLFQIALGDRTVPNSANSFLIREADGLEQTRLYRHDRAFAADPTIGTNPHAYLVDILTASGRIVANAAQSQMAGFLASDGMVIRDANSGLGAPFTEPLFEAPRALPDSLGAMEAAVTSAASFVPNVLAPESIGSAFSPAIATGVQAAMKTPLPVTLGGTTIRVRDAAGRISPGRLFVVTPLQANFLLDGTVAEGTALFTAVNGLAEVSSGVFEIRRLTPAIFSANQMGSGVAAATFTAVRNGQEESGLIFACAAAGDCAGVPLDLGGEGDELYLTLFGTGLRGVSDLSAVEATIGDQPVAVQFAGAQGGFVGLDQVNLGPVSRELVGSGENAIRLSFDGVSANTVSVSFE